MISKNEIKYIQSLHAKKARKEEQVFLVEGTKLVEELIHSNYTIKKIYALPEWKYESSNFKLDITTISPQELEQISLLQTPHQVVAIAHEKVHVAPLNLTNQLTLVIDGVQDPGNLGTIIRTADWFGIKQIICSIDTVDFYNPKVIQSTMGSFTRVDVWYENLEALLATTNLPIYAAMLKGESIYKFPPTQQGLLIIGNESKGIRDSIIPFIQQRITIPRLGTAESLNAAVATAIILSHLVGANN